jgi:hypothetical protein
VQLPAAFSIHSKTNASASDACPSCRHSDASASASLFEWTHPFKRTGTVLSFDSLLASSGAVVIQPILGRVADVWSYPASCVGSGAIQALALPFIWLARRQETARRR